MSIAKAFVGLLPAVLLCAAGHPRAPVVRCTFTEPFVTTVYDPARKSLTIDRDGAAQARMFGGIVATWPTRTALELRERGGRLIQRLDRTMRGSDGMSDTRYPYAATWHPADPDMPQTLYGGCR